MSQSETVSNNKFEPLDLTTKSKNTLLSLDMEVSKAEDDSNKACKSAKNISRKEISFANWKSIIPSAVLKKNNQSCHDKLFLPFPVTPYAIKSNVDTMNSSKKSSKFNIKTREESLKMIETCECIKYEARPEKKKQKIINLANVKTIFYKKVYAPAKAMCSYKKLDINTKNRPKKFKSDKLPKLSLCKYDPYALILKKNTNSKKSQYI